MSQTTPQASLARAVGRGMDSISLNNGDHLRREAQKSWRRSQTRTERGWTAVGSALREQIAKYQEPR